MRLHLLFLDIKMSWIILTNKREKDPEKLWTAILVAGNYGMLKSAEMYPTCLYFVKRMSKEQKDRTAIRKILFPEKFNKVAPDNPNWKLFDEWGVEEINIGDEFHGFWNDMYFPNQICTRIEGEVIYGTAVIAEFNKDYIRKYEHPTF